MRNDTKQQAERAEVAYTARLDAYAKVMPEAAAAGSTTSIHPEYVAR